MKKLICTAIAALLLASPVFAAEENVSVCVNGEYLYENEALLIDDTTYVCLGDFRESVGDRDGGEITVYPNLMYGYDRCIYTEAGSFSRNGEYYVPLRSVCALYCAGIEWDAVSATAFVSA